MSNDFSNEPGPRNAVTAAIDAIGSLLNRWRAQSRAFRGESSAPVLALLVEPFHLSTGGCLSS